MERRHTYKFVDSLGFYAPSIKGAARQKKDLCHNVFAALYIVLNLDILRPVFPARSLYSEWIGTGDFISDWTLGVFAALVVLKHLTRSDTFCTNQLRTFEVEWMELAAQTQRKSDPFTLRCVCQHECHEGITHIDEHYAPVRPLWPDFIFEQLHGTKKAWNGTYQFSEGSDVDDLGDDSASYNYEDEERAERQASDNSISHEANVARKLYDETALHDVEKKARVDIAVAFPSARPVAVLDEWALATDPKTPCQCFIDE
jgi:hypothetical protein